MTIYSQRRCEDNIPVICCQSGLRPIIPLPPVEPEERAFADYYALAPTDNAAAITAGNAVAFPRGSSSDFSDISRIDDSSFNLAKSGAYLVMFSVDTVASAQLELELNGNALAYTVAGNEADGGLINGLAIITVTQPNSVLSVINPVGNTDLTVAQNAGGTEPSASHLTIVKLA